MILLTGGNGFLGKHIATALQGEDLCILGRKSGEVVCDLAKEVPQLPACSLVIHAAGKAHCLAKTDEEREAFYETNVLGTEHLLQGLEKGTTLPEAFVFISSVAVYGLAQGMDIDEQAPLLAIDAYGKSKAEAEALLQKWCTENNVRLTILRLPLVVGANAPGNLAAMSKAITQNLFFNIAGGSARRSMVLATDVASAILPFSKIGGIYNLTDGEDPSYQQLSQALAENLKARKPGNLPYSVARALSLLGTRFKRFPLSKDKLLKLTSTLTFSTAKAKATGLWTPKSVLKNLP